MMDEVGRKKEKTRCKETVVERNEREVETNAVDGYEEGKGGSVNIGDGKDEEDEEKTIVKVRMNKDRKNVIRAGSNENNDGCVVSSIFKEESVME